MLTRLGMSPDVRDLDAARSAFEPKELVESHRFARELIGGAR